MQFTHRPDAAALEAVLADFEKGAGKLSLKDFSVGVSTIPQWHKRSKHDCVAGAKALRKQAEELLAGGQSEAARQLMAVATRLDPRMQAPLEPPPMPAPHYEFPPHMMKDTYQTLHLNYGHEKLFADVDQLARDFASKNTLTSPSSSSSLNRSASKTSITTPLPQRSASSASLASSSSALPALGSSSGSGSAGLASTIGVHDAQRLKTHLLSSAKHNKAQLEFVTHNLYANAPHPPLYIAGDDYFNKTLPHRDRLEPAAAYSGTATLRPIQVCARVGCSLNNQPPTSTHWHFPGGFSIHCFSSKNNAGILVLLASPRSNHRPRLIV